MIVRFAAKKYARGKFNSPCPTVSIHSIDDVLSPGHLWARTRVPIADAGSEPAGGNRLRKRYGVRNFVKALLSSLGFYNTHTFDKR